MKNIQNINIEYVKDKSKLTLLMAAMIALLLALSVSASWAKPEADEFDEAYIFFELNNTDGDLGIHAKIDGEPWKWLTIKDHKNKRVLTVNTKSRLRRQGLTELFFESAEPPFDELSPDKFFNRFPEGEYTVTGRTLERIKVRSKVVLSHVMPAPPEVWLEGNYETVAAAENCDVEDLPEFEFGETITIIWYPVETSHPDLGAYGDIEVHNYEVVVEIDETPWKTSSILSPDDTMFVIPQEILALAEFDEEGEAEVKFEVLVRAEESFNQTAVESCFVLVQP